MKVSDIFNTFNMQISPLQQINEGWLSIELANSSNLTLDVLALNLKEFKLVKCPNGFYEIGQLVQFPLFDSNYSLVLKSTKSWSP